RMCLCPCENGPSPRASAFTHSAPSRVLPEPRPPTTSQLTTGARPSSSNPSGYCASRACPTQASRSSFSRSGVSTRRDQLACKSLSQFDDAIVDAPEYGGQLFIAQFFFFLLRAFRGQHLPALHHAHEGDKRLDLGLLDLLPRLG